MKPWLLQSWCGSEVTADFRACLKDVLDLYLQPYDPARPTVCFDEQNVQLLADSRPGLPLRPGYVKRRDYEYVRRGTRNLFMFAEPKAGLRHLVVTQHRTKEDFAKAMRYLVDALYPQVPLIDVVLDNLNTHNADTVIEIFGKPEADRILAHVVWHPTPLHASWVNIAEIELSAMTQQCLDRRIPDEWRLGQEVLAWESERNEIHKPVAWSFDWKRAKRIFRKKKRHDSLGTTAMQN